MNPPVICTLERHDGTAVKLTTTYQHAKVLIAHYHALGFTGAGWEVAV